MSYPNWNDVKRAQKINKRKKFIEYVQKFTKYLPCLFLSILLWAMLNFVLKNMLLLSIDANYILSSIAQGLASVIALLFVIIFFICQVTNRISMFWRLLNPDGFMLLSIFMITIIISLIGIKMGSDSFIVNLSIAMAAFCLFSLIPFVITVRNLSTIYWIRHKIAELNFPKHPLNVKMCEEFLDELSSIGAKEIVGLEIENNIYSILNFITRTLYSETNFSNKVIAMELVVELGVYAMTKKGYVGLLKYTVDKVGAFFSDNTIPISPQRKVGFQIACGGISTILSRLKLKGRLDDETMKFFAKKIIIALIALFNKLKVAGNGKTKENQKKLEEIVKAYIRRDLIFVKDFEISLNEAIGQTEIAKEVKEEFKTYLKNLLIVQNSGDST